MDVLKTTRHLSHLVDPGGRLCVGDEVRDVRVALVAAGTVRGEAVEVPADARVPPAVDPERAGGVVDL